MTDYKIIRPANGEEILEATIGNPIGPPQLAKDEPCPLIIGYNCPKCGQYWETMWLFPDTPMIYDSDCHGMVEFKQEKSRYEKYIGVRIPGWR